MGAMEAIHAKSYSTIFITLATEDEINNVFDWVDQNPLLERKLELITKYYAKLFTPDTPKVDLYMALVAINPIVENGFRTHTKNHDFFSVKGNGYVKATNVEKKLRDEDFIFCD